MGHVFLSFILSLIIPFRVSCSFFCCFLPFLCSFLMFVCCVSFFLSLFSYSCLSFLYSISSFFFFGNLDILWNVSEVRCKTVVKQLFLWGHLHKHKMGNLATSQYHSTNQCTTLLPFCLDICPDKWELRHFSHRLFTNGSVRSTSELSCILLQTWYALKSPV